MNNTETRVVVHIDMRETQLIEFFRQNADAIAIHKIDWKVVPLDIGDIWLELKTNEDYMTDNVNKNNLYVFERKSFQDLASSIKDGRYKEQKARWLSTVLPSHSTYIIEGCPSSIWSKAQPGKEYMNGLKTSVYGSFFIHTVYRDGIHVFLSKNTVETAQYMIEIAIRMKKHPEYFVSREYQNPSETGLDEQTKNEGVSNSNYLDICAIKTKKKENITPQVCFLLQLGQIPGISAKIAKLISDHSQCTTMRALIKQIEDQGDTYEAKLKYFSDFPMIGKKKATLILNYFGFYPPHME